MARLPYYTLEPELYKQYLAFNEAVGQKPALKGIKELVTLRASQINGCAFCVDMHVKEAKLKGERELRLHHVAIWHESPLFNDKERAALQWTETLTRLPAEGVSDALYQSMLKEFSEEDLTALTFLIVAINGWNRLGIAFQPVPGSSDKLLGLDKAGLV